MPNAWHPLLQLTECYDLCSCHKEDDLLSFFQHHFQIKLRNGSQPAAGFQQVPKEFMKEYLQPYHSAFRAIISVDGDTLAAEPSDSGGRGQYDADIKWSRSILYQLKCFPTQGWRTSALLAVKLAQNYPGDAKQAATWLKCFLTELEAISLAALFVLGAKANARRQKTFDAVVKSLLQGQFPWLCIMLLGASLLRCCGFRSQTLYLDMHILCNPPELLAVLCDGQP